MTAEEDARVNAGWVRMMREALTGEDYDAAAHGVVSEWGCEFNGPMTGREAAQIVRDHRNHPADTCRVKARAVRVLEAEGRRVPDSGRQGYGAAVARLAEHAPRHGHRFVAHLRRKNVR